MQTFPINPKSFPFHLHFCSLHMQSFPSQPNMNILSGKSSEQDVPADMTQMVWSVQKLYTILQLNSEIFKLRLFYYCLKQQLAILVSSSIGQKSWLKQFMLKHKCENITQNESNQLLSYLLHCFLLMQSYLVAYHQGIGFSFRH